jgi:hypothetical protein
MRQWQAPTRGSCSPEIVIVTAPQRQWPVIVEVAGVVDGCMFRPPEIDARQGQPACRGQAPAWTGV